MFIIIGIVVVFGAVVGGFLMEHGNLKVLMQPAELVTIGGAALGTIFVANPLYIVKKLVGGLAGAFGGSKYGKQQYLDTLKMMFELFSRARLRENDVAARLGVDPKTVRRWLNGPTCSGGCPEGWTAAGGWQILRPRQDRFRPVWRGDATLAQW